MSQYVSWTLQLLIHVMVIGWKWLLMACHVLGGEGAQFVVAPRWCLHSDGTPTFGATDSDGAVLA